MFQIGVCNERREIMIESKEDLKEYLEADRISLNRGGAKTKTKRFDLAI